jgi:hypothetical protein
MYQLTIAPFTYPVTRKEADAALFKEHGRAKSKGQLSTDDMALVSLALTDEATRPDTTSEQVATRDGTPTIVEGASVFGWTVRDKTADELAAEVISKRQGMSCSKMQGILTLGEAAWGEVQTYRETASWAEQMVIDSAQDWNRTSQNIAFFGWLLSYTDAQMDTMFTAAAQVTA